METQFPTNRYYTQDHEWIQQTPETGIFVIGITQYATEQLGDVVFLDTSLISVGQPVQKKQSCATIESIKSVADIYSPISGTIDSFNLELEQAPEQVGASPYDQGWIVKIKAELSDLESEDNLLNADQYASFVSSL